MTSEAEHTRSPSESVRFVGFILDAAEGRLARGEEILPLRRRTLAVCISELWKALDDSAKIPRFIESG
jgi:hypothetical protein